MAVSIYRFQEHNLAIEGEKDDLLYIAGLLHDADGTIGDLRDKIEYAFDVKGTRINDYVDVKIFRTIDQKLSKYNGTEVEIIRTLTRRGHDSFGMLYSARFYDGTVHDVWEDELEDIL